MFNEYFLLILLILLILVEHVIIDIFYEYSFTGCSKIFIKYKTN